jgi:hypothetical protein
MRPLSIKDMRLFITGPDGTETEVAADIQETATGAPPAGSGEILALPEWPASVTFAITPEQASWLRYVLVVRRLLYEPLEYRLN